MRKVLFLMFLLLLMGLGAAGVKAQVRIGGNTAPSAAAVLDLNASDAANLATGGLVLPRVDLKSSSMQLTNGVANVTGTLVYDVTTTLGRIGVYYWNGANWVLASLPLTSAADSGKFLTSNGQSWVVAGLYQSMKVVTAAVSTAAPQSVTWTKILEATFPLHVDPDTYYQININGLNPGDLCYQDGIGFDFYAYANQNAILLFPLRTFVRADFTVPIRCYRPSV